MNFKYYLNTYKKQNGTFSIRLKLETSKNDVQYIDSKVSVLKTQWDPKKQLIKKHQFEEQLNAELTSLLNNVQSVYYKNREVSAKRLLQIYKNSKQYDSSSFLDFYDQIIQEMDLKKKHRSAKTNQVYLTKLKKFASFISFSDLSPTWAKDYENYLLKEGNSVNTVASNFKAIYATLNKAVKLGIIDKNPIKGYEIVTENTEKDSLTYEQIQKLIKFNIHKRFKGMVTAKDMFLFSFYTAGMRFTDMCKLEWKNVSENEIIYTMNKSKNRSGSRRTIPLIGGAKGILEKYKGKNDKYVFPPLYGYEESTVKEQEYRIYIRNNALNRSLKQIDKHMEFGKELNLHMAKHSFADYAVKNKIDILMISKLLGHTKLATTQHYLKDFYQEMEYQTMNDLFNDGKNTPNNTKEELIMGNTNFIDIEDDYPKKQGEYQVKVHTESGYRESIAKWTPEGFILIDDTLQQSEYIKSWK
ncbi:tyrosine-type recombinase/integrase [Aestuariibaculum marinum]|uniref:Site-specific integrase n=1 Tax=Aestuariibaculum marinum TaxID=2683592 RepID=A0A8J6PSE6_9FLAO|nr:site-specific integrase [Aestuariibaculum marinum]MBD0822668.1 site-specific integrase [Aestuariibaculum marinum]